MKLTRTQLKEIIREEIKSLLENRGTINNLDEKKLNAIFEKGKKVEIFLPGSFNAVKTMKEIKLIGDILRAGEDAFYQDKNFNIIKRLAYGRGISMEDGSTLDWPAERKKEAAEWDKLTSALDYGYIIQELDYDELMDYWEDLTIAVNNFPSKYL